MLELKECEDVGIERVQGCWNYEGHDGDADAERHEVPAVQGLGFRVWGVGCRV